MIFIIAHYDHEGHLAQHIIDHVRYISVFAKQVIFVSTHLKEEYTEVLAPYASILIRPNIGYDFWSYKLGLELIININEANHIIMWNSSFVCFQPSQLYRRYFKHLNQDGMYGLSTCSAPLYHIQSYFFSFYGKSVINSPAFKNWWGNMTPISDRNEVIRTYEVGMSQWFTHHQIALHETTKLSISDVLGIIPNYLDNIQLNRHWIKKLFKKSNLAGYKALNITHFLWEKLFNEYSIIKIELLVNNPTHQKIVKLKWLLNDEQQALLKNAIGERNFKKHLVNEKI
ncbi:MAG TPA: rhamnan synthesis F family protein [Methylotenera sp.]|nr:rhamnan synthesis F family protein [Methylotenera sp.]